MISLKKQIISMILLLAMLSVLLVPARAAETQAAAGTEVVRVGWYQSDMFQEGLSDDEIKSGYCYDYLQNVANYTKWSYEYVYGDWTELFSMLENGEIDVLAGVSVTEERKEHMLFPETAMGNDEYYLYKRADDSSISITDFSTLSGKTVGGITNNRATTMLESWIAENDVDLQIVYYDSFDDQETDFESGKLDLMVQTINNVLTMDGISIVAKVGEEPFYLAISKDRPELLSELNGALTTMLAINPYLLQDLQVQNYGATLTSRTVTEEEKQWVAAHPVITVGYLSDYLPYSSTDENGQATGVMTDVLSAILQGLGMEDSLTVQYQAYSDYGTMIRDLKSGEIDTAFPVYGDLWDLEQIGIDATGAVVSGTESLFRREDFAGNTVESLAVNKNNDMQIAYCKRNFPDTALIPYGSITECLQAVLDGEADGTVINSLRTEMVTENTHYRDLTYVQLSAEEDRCFGLRPDETELLELLNRGLRIIGTTYGVDNSYKYMSDFNTYTTLDFLREHTLPIGAVLTVILFVIVFTLTHSMHRYRRAARERETALLHAEQLNAELEQRQTQLEEAKVAAEAADRAKTTFLFNMSHDIRTPMNAIIGFTELLEKHLDDRAQAEEYLGKIRYSNDFLLSLINNVLEMARIESGKETLNEERCNIREFDHQLETVFASLMEEKGLRFRMTTRVEHETVIGDRTKTKEIFLNILSNAQKYTPAGGSVTFDTTELPSDTEGMAVYQTVISDTGIGMSAEFLPHLFEAFSREKNSTESRVMGTGLGMPIVKNLVSMMNGTISVESEQGRGTTFTVTIPHRIAEPETAGASAAPEPQPESISLEGKRILLAEDNELNAEIATEILGEAGFLVERAADGAICVDMLKQAEAGWYDLILMDIQMPNMNGYEATKAIRALDDPAKASIPIIAMTANAFEEDKRNALQAGMNAHLAKPINVEVLLKTLTELLGSLAKN